MVLDTSNEHFLSTFANLCIQTLQFRDGRDLRYPSFPLFHTSSFQMSRGRPVVAQGCPWAWPLLSLILSPVWCWAVCWGQEAGLCCLYCALSLSVPEPQRASLPGLHAWGLMARRTHKTLGVQRVHVTTWLTCWCHSWNSGCLMGPCVGFKTGSSPDSGGMVTGFLIQKTALIIVSTHWDWVSIQ